MTAPATAASVRHAASATPGFLSEDEGACLCAAACRAATTRVGPLVEIGAYLGRSTLFLAAGIVQSGVPARLYSVDHHRGSEEMQEGWIDHDPSLVDRHTGSMDSLPRWRRAISSAGVESTVVGVIGESSLVARDWTTPLSLVFIDGGHGSAVSWGDYRGWAPLVAPGGLLIFHDVYPDPRDGGRPPFECYLDAIASGLFVENTESAIASVRVLIRSGENTAVVALPPASRSVASKTAAVE
jgi:predicted O-methyltransferase YrrM